MTEANALTDGLRGYKINLYNLIDVNLADRVVECLRRRDLKGAKALLPFGSEASGICDRWVADASRLNDIRNGIL